MLDTMQNKQNCIIIRTITKNISLDIKGIVIMTNIMNWSLKYETKFYIRIPRKAA